jgi:hypothetical protein
MDRQLHFRNLLIEHRNLSHGRRHTNHEQEKKQVHFYRLKYF